MKRMIAILTSPFDSAPGKRLCLFVAAIAIFLFISSSTASAHITGLVPSSTDAGGPDFTLRILGSDFDDSDARRVLFDGTRVAARLVSPVGPGGNGPVELNATIPASLITRPGIVKVELEGFNSLDFKINPAPGAPCPATAYKISPESFTVDSDEHRGGSITVTAPEGCPWTAESSVPWIGIAVTELSGNGTVSLFIGSNDGSWRAGVISVAGKPFTVYQDGDCPIKLIDGFLPGLFLKGERALTVSRRFRDGVLAESPRGQRYTQLYYKFSTEAVGLMMLNPMLIMRSREILERYKPVIQSMVEGKQVTLTRGDLEEIESFLNSFAEKGSAELRETLKGLREDLRDTQVHTEFNITVTEGPKRELPAPSAVETMKETGMMITPVGLLLFCIYAQRSRRKIAKFGMKLISVAIVSSMIGGQWSIVSGQNRTTASRPASLKLKRDKAPHASEHRAELPLTFEANQGQSDPQVKFISRTSRYKFFLTPTETVMRMRSQNQEETEPITDVLRMKLIGANPDAQIGGLDKTPAVSNYFVGTDSSKWRDSVPTYSRVIYSQIYPGVDMVYYGAQDDLEYDFKVAPGADPAQIRLGFEGVERIEIDASGNLVLGTRGGELRQRKPKAYQEVSGSRRPVTCRYRIRNPQSAIRSKEVDLDIGAYDRSKPLIIDPVLVYSTYFGGGGNEEGNSITVDSAGNVYITGLTDSINFPLANSSQPNLGGGQQDAFVVKLDPSGTRVVYSTYIGGDGQDNGTSIAVDPAGNAYITGFTDSTNFPVRNALQPAKRGSFNALVVKLDPAGSMLNSTLFGGSISDYGSSIAVDTAGNTYVAGIATSPDIPITNALQSTTGGLVDIFVAKIDPSGNQLVYSTYLGGSAVEGASSIAVDGAGSVYITGLTSSRDFRTVNALQATHGGGMFDAFVTKLNPSGTQVIYSTYLGGGGEDRAFRIAVDSTGSAYMTGDTDSTNFPVVNAAQPANGGSADAFVAKLNASGSQLVYSTYLGGSGIDGGTAIAVDAAGSAYVTGFTASTNFPTANPVQSVFGGVYDGFVAKLSASGSTLDYSTYLGGSGTDSVFGVAADSADNAYVMGVTNSTNFPAVNPFQKTNAGGIADLFIAKISSGPAIMSAVISGKRLLVFGSGFDNGAKILIDGQAQKTANDEQNPTGALIAKKAGKKIKAGDKLRVRNANGSLSQEFTFLN